MRHLLLVLACAVFLATASADILPAGHKGIPHQLVFEDSKLLRKHRIVAAPVAGFNGVAIVEPGVPFHFSTKYRTLIYLVPDDVVEVEQFDRDRFAAWPSCPPPRSEIRSVPLDSPVTGALTTVRLFSADASGLVVEEVSHVEFGGPGIPAPGDSSFRAGIILIAGGVVLCTVALLLLRWCAKRPAAAFAPDAVDDC